MSIFISSPARVAPPPLARWGFRSATLAARIVRVAFVLAAGLLFAGHARSESPFLADPQVGSTIADAVMRSRLPASTKLHHGAWPEPRSTEPPALTGTEGLSLSVLRASLQGYYGFQTAQDVEERVAVTRATARIGSPGALGPPEGAVRVTGWAYLMLNWARATLLGNIDAANGFLNEARKVKASFTEEWAGLEYWTGASATSKIPTEGFYRWSTVQYSYLLSIATLLESEAVALPDAFDPEGYIRQTLQYASHEVTRAANKTVTMIDSFPAEIR